MLFILGFFTLGIYSTSPLNAQVPDYFANNPEWKMRNAFGVNGPCVTDVNYVLYVQGDTVIGPHTYKKMRIRGTYQYFYVNAPGCTQTDHFSDDPYMFVRQDSTRIWKYNSFGDELLYNYDLQVGDTLPNTILTNITDTIIVDSISNIVTGNSNRKVFHLSTTEPILLIEGIAAITGIGNGGFLVSFPSPINFEFLQEFYCYAQDDTVYYPSFQAPCNLNVGIEQILEKYPINFYPNPVENYTMFRLPGDNPIRITCNNLLGQEFQLPFEQTAPGEWKINTSGLNKGVYFLTIQNGAVQSLAKMMKN